MMLRLTTGLSIEDGSVDYMGLYRPPCEFRERSTKHRFPSVHERSAYCERHAKHAKRHQKVITLVRGAKTDAGAENVLGP
jgi:hypothetical protein